MPAQQTDEEQSGVLTAFARVVCLREGLTDDEARFVAWSVLNQDQETGMPLPAEENPYYEKASEADRKSYAAAVVSWLTLRDNALWTRLAEVLQAEVALTLIQQLRVLDLCRVARTRSPQERLAIKTYSRVWPTRSRTKLVQEIAGLARPAVVCDYMSSYKPRGLVPALPFGLAAEVVVASLQPAGLGGPGAAGTSLPF